MKHLLVTYVNGELPPDERNSVTRHLAGCEDCRRALAAETQLAAELRARLPVLTAPTPGQLARLWPGVAARTAPGSAPSRPRVSRRLPALAPTFGMALTFGLLFALILPLLGGGNVHIAEATQPRPEATATNTAPASATVTVTTAAATPSPTAVALASPTAPGVASWDALAPTPTALVR
ncbi:MAG: hypothetical protein Kow00120_13870 [Anaerolineae bacterium]